MVQHEPLLRKPASQGQLLSMVAEVLSANAAGSPPVDAEADSSILVSI
jgi:hypothetical protein